MRYTFLYGLLPANILATLTSTPRGGACRQGPADVRGSHFLHFWSLSAEVSRIAVKAFWALSPAYDAWMVPPGGRGWPDLAGSSPRGPPISACSAPEIDPF